MANRWKGTFNIELEGKELELRPSFDACEEFEGQTGIAVQDAQLELNEGKAQFKTVVAAIWAGLKGASFEKNDPNYCPSYRVLGERLRADGGMEKWIFPAIRFLTYCMKSDVEIDKIEEALEEKKILQNPQSE